MTITEVSKEYELSPDTLRYYERVGLIPPVTRNGGGIRDYQEKDLKWVSFAKCMRSAGLPVEVLIDYVNLWRQGDSTAAARKELLLEQREVLSGKISEMQATLERLDNKIKRYDDVLIPRMNRLMDPEDEEGI